MDYAKTFEDNRSELNAEIAMTQIVAHSTKLCNFCLTETVLNGVLRNMVGHGPLAQRKLISHGIFKQFKACL